MRRRGLLLGALAAPAIARAQARPVKIVVPFPPGGAADITARLLAEQMAPLLNQPVVIENRPGAGGNIAAEAVARSAPDGGTVFLGGATIFCANRYLYRSSMPFDALRDFAHISRVSIGTTLLVTRADRPWRDFGQFVAAAKAAPGRLSAGNSGWGTISNLTIAKLCKAAGIEIGQVPYRGLAPGINDLLAGNLDLLFDGLPAIVPHVREGRLRALAVGSAKRVTYVPGIEDVPGMAELIPGTDMDMAFWYCLSAPAGTPAELVTRFHQATIGAARSPAYAEKLLPLGFTAITDDSPAALTELIRREDAVWKGLVELSGVRLD
ncbi:tripartite tricarboxylate transporter substrate binding protein [Dankookia sp. P2]|uniref:tripartite tricarboxylate transporter substrate binding protein n=1 Tax=Dankookia sp. P2 TaxID=3423955 RepID=UPI003D66C31B